MNTKNIDLTMNEVAQIVQDQSAWKVINSLLEKGLIEVYENLQDNYKSRQENFVFMLPAYKDEEALKLLFDKLEKAPKQLQLLMTYLHIERSRQVISQKELLQEAQSTSAQLKALVDKQIFQIKKMDVDRVRFEAPVEPIHYALSPAQQIAYEQIQQGFANKKPILLKGITGSGKTHIYFKCIEDCLAQGKTALYLLPEIALTTQIVRKLRAVFGEQVGMYHSRYSNNERVEIWNKMRQGEYKIIIGARSALLLPFVNLGLVIVDEEHDASYKQQDLSPRYQARDTAIYLALQNQAFIILGSATPSIESYYNAEQGKYQLVELNSRYGLAGLPAIQLVDTKQEILLKKQQGIFSQILIDAIQKTIQQKKQVILFQNRRGYSPFIQCNLCGWVPHCKYCDVSLTYHKESDKLHCHYCGTKSPNIKICGACGHTKMMAKSYGTEKIEEEIRQIFPHARIQRFDWDAMKNKNRHQEIIRQFEQGEIDILVGTQMVVKGLDFEHVNLVGVLSADGLLSYPDFRTNERFFQLLEQVSGRAGRKEDEGQVIIQLFKTNHPTILNVQAHDYLSFYQTELSERSTYQYPPFTRLIKITLKHQKQEVVMAASIALAEELKNLPHAALFGPADPPVSRIRNQFLREILLKINRDSDKLAQVKKALKEKIQQLATTKNFSNVRVVLDVDPY
jgi:primosomal protein N' (replication factor Y)